MGKKDRLQLPQGAEESEALVVRNGAAARRIRGDEVDDAFDDGYGLDAPFYVGPAA